MCSGPETKILYDPEDEQTQLDPYPTYRRLRDERPVYRQEHLRFRALSRFADGHAALNDHEAFCSRQGLTWDPAAAATSTKLTVASSLPLDRALWAGA